MSLLVKQAITELRTAIMDAAGRAVADGEFPVAPLSDFIIEVPANRENGDYSSNAAMAWARDLKCAPRKIAQTLADRLFLSDTFFDRCEIAGPGFMNFYLKDSFNACIIQDILEKSADYGRSNYGAGKKINIEFVSANPTGPMHMGNARGGALGDCLAAVMDFAGYNVSREFYVNDAGNQIDKFGLSLDIRYQQLFKGEKAVELPEDSYHGEDIIQRAKEFAEINGDKYLDAPESERRQALVDYALPKNIAAMKENLTKYRIEYDTWFLESTLHNDGELKETIEIMKSKGLTYEKDGALWYKNKEVLGKRLAKEGKTPEEIERLELKDEVLIRTNGNPTYFAADIAYHRNKLQIRGFEKAIDVWGADHHGHVARMKGALDAIGCSGDDLDIILMQLVRLTRDGEVVRMSKRSGKAITLVDLLEEIPIDAVRFLFNMREPGSQMDFDLDLAVEQSSQNPVYYCQYAHARICSILKKLAAEGKEPRECSIPELSLLTAPEEKELIKHLSSLTDEIIAAARNYDPAKITRYAVDLATLFHKFYNSCRVNCDDEALMQARLSLCLCVKTVLSNVLTMFRITVPESM
ncbi:MAG: arginine--tRNA ligase [Oscillospiraceae bacterium]|nr:arginine--tRNA ligase [Clostridiaceae bacterium]MDY5948230.1 arginine--tRNA ligase [Oscillospiraceae bacterium]